MKTGRMYGNDNETGEAMSDDGTINPAETAIGRLRRYKGLSTLEQVGLFIGKAQILEAAMKSLAREEFGMDPNTVERLPLGPLTRELERAGLRGDYVTLLDGFRDYRNHITHEYLANEAMLRELVGNAGRLEQRQFDKGAFELEQLLYIYEQMTEHGGDWREAADDADD